MEPSLNYEPGLVIGDRYELDEVIATDGIGQVWRATDLT